MSEKEYTPTDDMMEFMFTLVDLSKQWAAEHIHETKELVKAEFDKRPDTVRPQASGKGAAVDVLSSATLTAIMAQASMLMAEVLHATIARFIDEIKQAPREYQPFLSSQAAVQVDQIIQQMVRNATDQAAVMEAANRAGLSHSRQTSAEDWLDALVKSRKH